jgi:DNA-directed RNA polymerase II subunit RPB2
MSQSTQNKQINIDDCTNSYDDITWNVIQKYFEDNPQVLVQHHTDSYNAFVDRGIEKIIENSPYKEFEVSPSSDKKGKKSEETIVMKVILGSYRDNDAEEKNEEEKDSNNDDKSIHFFRPTIDASSAVKINNNEESNQIRYLYPNECRLLNKTYEMEVKLKVTILVQKGEVSKKKSFDFSLCSMPIMVQSNKCILDGMPKLERYNMGECRNDYGGYFIINGKEKTLVSQEEFGNNMLRVYKDKTKTSPYSYLADIRTVGEDTSMLPRTLSVRLVAPDAKFTNNNIVVSVPNLHRPIPLFILFRALGIESDKDIIEMCLLDMKANSDMIELFRPSVHDTTVICKYNHKGKKPQSQCSKCLNLEERIDYEYVLTQCDAIEYLCNFVKGRKKINVIECLNDYFLPNIGTNNYIEKGMFLGYMVYNLLSVSTGRQNETDRDSYKFKRIKTSGTLLYGLFTEYFKVFSLDLKSALDRYMRDTDKKQTEKVEEILKGIDVKKYFPTKNAMNTGIKKAFKGRWGSTVYTRQSKKGVVQDVKRLSYNSFMSHLRKVVTPMDESTKVVKPHMLHNSQYGIIDPLDTPDGGKIGLHKYLALGAHITESFTKENNKELVDTILIKKFNMIPLEALRPETVKSNTKVFLNGTWIGIFDNSDSSSSYKPNEIMNRLRNMRLTGKFSPYASISWNIQKNQINIFTDAGRLTRPVFTVDKSKPGYENLVEYNVNLIKSNKISWNELIYGKDNIKAPKEDGTLNFNNSSDATDDDEPNIGVISYLDTTEEETVLIANYKEQLESSKYYTHLEIHPSLMLGYMGNQIVFPENNQLPRNLFSCGQSQQAVSLYNSNYFARMDKMAVVLNYGQVPLIKSRYTRLMNNEEHPYGENAIVAIMVYGGYNVEDSILFNEGAIKRGLFRTTYYSMYESKECQDSTRPPHASGVPQNEDDEHDELMRRSESKDPDNTDQEGRVNDNNYDMEEIEDVDAFDDDDDEDMPQNPLQCRLEENSIFTNGGNDTLDKYGVIKINSEVNEKSSLIGTETWITGEEDRKKLKFVKPKKGQLGFVDKTYISNTPKGTRIAKVSIREERVPAIGDKFCSRCGQKGTIGQIIPEEDMPFTSNGVKPDLIINPHALPSRMTIGQIIECVMGKACLEIGGYGDCTAFINKDTSPYQDFGNVLPLYGYHSHGSEILYNGMSGKQLEADIYIGPTYYMRLKHMVKDKINYRAEGERTNLTRQTTKGRANDGGLRIGEMERDGMIGYGASMFLQESMLTRGDEYYMAICNSTGSIAIYNHVKNIYISPMCDGPLRFEESPDINSKFITSNNSGIDISRIREGRIYGKSFSIIRIPYAFKLLMQELHTMNIQMKIITEDNIDQLTNVAMSKNSIRNYFNEETGDSIKEKEITEGIQRDGEDEVEVQDDEDEDDEEEKDEDEDDEDEDDEDDEDDEEEKDEDEDEDEDEEVDVEEEGNNTPLYDVEEAYPSEDSISYAVEPTKNDPSVIKVDSNVILMKPGSQQQDLRSSSLAEKERELQLELDILDTKQRIAALEKDTKQTDSISSMSTELSNDPPVKKREDGIELLIDSSSDDNNRKILDAKNNSEKESYSSRSENNTGSEDSNTKQIRI